MRCKTYEIIKIKQGYLPINSDRQVKLHESFDSHLLATNESIVHNGAILSDLSRISNDSVITDYCIAVKPLTSAYPLIFALPHTMALWRLN